MKIAYIGIDLLASALYALRSYCTITEVFTCKTDNVVDFNIDIKQAAKEMHLPCTDRRITKDDLSRLQKEGCDAIVCAGYYYLVPTLASLPAVNIHPAYLPTGRGPWPMPVAILKNLSYGGVTIHKMANAFDSGDILLQKKFPLSKDETLPSYMEQVNTCLPAMLKQLIENFSVLYQNAKPQGKGEYWAEPTKKDWTITPDMPAEQADRILRAFLGCECLYQTKERTYSLIGGRLVFKSDDHRFPVGNSYIKAESIKEE